MKTKSDMKPIIIATLSLILLAGCGNDDFPVEEQKVPLEIASAFVTGDVQTRAVTPQLLTSGSIGVFLEGESGTSYVKKDNIQYDYNSAWKPNTETIYLGGENANVCAYKKTTKLDLATKEAVSLTSQIFDAELDLVYAGKKTVNGTSAGKSVEFIMGHAYSQIEFVFSRENYPNTCRVTKIAIKNANIIENATLNLATAVYTPTKINAAFSYWTNVAKQADGIVVPESGTIKSNVLMIPCTLGNSGGTGVTLELTVDGKLMTVPVAYTKLGALTKGIIHQISLKLKGTALELSVKDTPWDNQPVDGEYNPEP
ncbi:fimbrillin family protein [Bacteroides fragilis]|uniref:fimbrillin family protein n=1 Tax=Bacteroides fragilis TaxID=817 RepID=UPI0032AF6CAE